MPLYEYFCTDCHTTFDALRSMSKADAPIVCSNCEGQNTSRVLSVFFARSESRGESQAVAGAGGGCGCGNGVCGCSHSHN